MKLATFGALALPQGGLENVRAADAAATTAAAAAVDAADVAVAVVADDAAHDRCYRC